MPGFFEQYESDAKAKREQAAAARAAAEAAEVARLNTLYGDYADAVTKAADRLQGLNKAVNDGTYARQSQRLADLNRQYDLTSLKLRNARLAADLASGAFYRQSQSLAKLNSQYAALQKQAQLQQLVAEHGKLGGVLRNNAAEISTLKTTALVGYLALTGIVASLVRSGLQGTVEGYRLSYAWERVGRQAAAIAVPAVEKLANWVGRLADRFERLSGGQQDFVLTLGLIALAAGPAIGAMRTLYTVSTAAFAVGKSIAAVSGLSNLAAGATSAAAGAAGAAGGKAAGAAAGGTAAGGAGAGSGVLGALAVPLAVVVGTLVLQAGTRTADKEYFSGNQAGDRLGRGTTAFARSLGMPAGLDALIGVGVDYGMGGKSKHRDMTPMEVGLNEAGTKAQSIQEEVLKVSAVRAEQEEQKRLDALEANTSIMEKLVKAFENFQAPGVDSGAAAGQSVADWIRRLRS